MLLPAVVVPSWELMIGLTRKERIPPQPLALGADQALSTSSAPLSLQDLAFFEEFDYPAEPVIELLGPGGAVVRRWSVSR